MKENYVRLIITASFTVALLTSCNPAEKKEASNVIKTLVVHEHPPVKPIHPELPIAIMPVNPNPTAEKFKAWIKGSKERTILKGKIERKTSLDNGKSLEEVARETILEEIDRAHVRATEEERKDIVADVLSNIATGDVSPDSGTNLDRPAGTNATIVGEPGSKNIRTGPGTNNGVIYSANPGDRVQILGTGQDQGGYSWYEVNFPNSGVNGWIAAQLIQPD